MPTYDYKCEKCEHAFEAFQSITAAPLKKCPSCKKPKLRRLIGTGAALLFKGDGFYITDYRSEKYKEAAKADSPATGDSAKPADAAPSAGAPAKADGGAKSPAGPPAKVESPKAPPAKSAKPRGKPR
ncbi:MAG TPA: zinc ribbon domain-containing protein [Tepidisphaeraceae bacterium]|nr:zinc ribbon domain-containing protein [Tepidisphaeraceae bacterium]